MTPADLTTHFHQVIPISKAMGIVVSEVSQRQAILTVPLQPNHNHLNTAFGGSLYAASALACYALFRFISVQAGHKADNLVLKEGSIRYFAAVGSDFSVVAKLVDMKEPAHFFSSLERRGRGQMEMIAEIHVPDPAQPGSLHQATEFRGIYVYRS